MAVSLPTNLPKPKEKGEKFVPIDTSKMRKDFDKRVSKLQAEGEGFWKKLSKHEGSGYGAAAGVGCGVGLGFGLTGVAGVDPLLSLHLPLQVVFGIGAGCGAGVGFGYGFGLGSKLEPYKSKSSKVKKI